MERLWNGSLSRFHRDDRAKRGKGAGGRRLSGPGRRSRGISNSVIATGKRRLSAQGKRERRGSRFG